MDNLTVIIPFYNGYKYIGALLSDIDKFGLPVILVDDLSDKPFTRHEKEIPPTLQIMVHTMPKKGYFTGACNAGIALCKTDVLILNQDTRLYGGEWLNIIANHRGEYGLIGEGISGGHPAWPAGYIHGTFMYIRRDVISKIGLMNERDFPLWGSTCEYQVRACRAGFKAKPIQSVGDFSHERKGRYGTSIAQVLASNKSDHDLLIRTPPLVSVIVPCYNYGRYLPDLIASMVGGNTSLGHMPGQSFQAFEAILVDDCSTDNTWEIMQGLADPWKGIRAIHKDVRSGTPGAINLGIRSSFGRAVTRLDADDMMETNRLEVLYRAWEEDKTRVVYDDNMLFANGKRYQHFKLADYDFDKCLQKNQMHCGILHSRKAYDEVGGYPEQMTMGREDWAMNIRLGIHGYCGYHIPQPLYLYRREGQNRTLLNTTKEMRTMFMGQMRTLYPEIYKGKKPMACCGKKPSPTTLKVIPSASDKVAQSLVGQDGLTLLRYIGSSQGYQFYYGPVTGTAYKFGLTRPTGFVANSDLTTGSQKRPGLLELLENGKKIFRIETIARATPAPAAPIAPAAPAATPAPAVVAYDGENEVSDLPLTDIAVMTLADVKKLFAGGAVSADEQREVALLIAFEKDGKKRKGVISYLEGLLNA